MLKVKLIYKITLVILLLQFSNFYAQSKNQASPELIKCNSEKSDLLKENDDLKKTYQN